VAAGGWDPSPAQPVLQAPDDDAEHGRGLLMVELISDQWGCQPSPELGGKTVWCLRRAKQP
jgi:hypothetical protein